MGFMVLLVMDKLLAVTRPFVYKQRATQTLAWKLGIGICAVNMIYSAPTLIIYSINLDGMCYHEGSTTSWILYYNHSYVIYNISFVAVIVLGNAIIASVVAKRMQRNTNVLTEAVKRRRQTERRSIYTLLIISALWVNSAIIVLVIFLTNVEKDLTNE